MLDAKDLQVLEEMFVRNLSSTEEKFEKKFTEMDARLFQVEKRFTEMDEKFERRFTEMDEKFERRFTEMDEKFEHRFAEMDEKFEHRFAEIDKKFGNQLSAMNGKVDGVESMILDELERTREILDKRIDGLQKDIDEIKQYYRLTKLEDENQMLLQNRVDDLDRRVRKPEEKTA